MEVNNERVDCDQLLLLYANNKAHDCIQFHHYYIEVKGELVVCYCKGIVSEGGVDFPIPSLTQLC